MRSVEDFGIHLATALSIELKRPPRASDDLFEDWGLDSLQAFQMLIILEAMAEAMVPPIEIPEIYTLGDALDYYQSLRGTEQGAG